MKYKSRVASLRRFESSWRRRLQIFWHDYQWPIILAVELLALILGYIGLAKNATATGERLSPLDLFYRMIQLIPMESGSVSGPIGWELEVARLLVPAVAAYAATKAFTIIFREQMQLIRLWFIKDHVIICGLGQKGLLLVDHFREAGEQVVVIEQDEDNNLLTLCRERGAITLIGDATDVALLRKAVIQRAKHIISVCGDDGTNAEVAVRAQEQSQNRRSGVLTCIIHIVAPQLNNLLKEQELGMEQFAPFRLELFNIFDRGARFLLQAYSPFTETGRVPHVLIIGLGNLGVNLVVQMARTWQDRVSPVDRRLPITVIDREANWKLEALVIRYPPLTKVCKFLAHQMDIRAPEFQRAEFLYNAQGQYDIDAIYICLDNDSLGLDAGLSLLNQIKQHPTPIFIRMVQHSGLATLLYGGYGGDGAFKNLHAFGLLDQTCTLDLVLGGTHEILARSLHEEYMRHQKQLGQTAQTNPVMVAWDQLPEALKESNRRQVDHIRLKLEAIGAGITTLTDWDAEPFEFKQAEVDLMARMEHERWVQERQLEGWKYAPGSKNMNKKTHPDLVPWEKLSQSAKDLNCNAVRDIPTFLAQAGFEIYRLVE